MRITREPLKSLLIDVENDRYELNGKPMEGISRLDIPPFVILGMAVPVLKDKRKQKESQ